MYHLLPFLWIQPDQNFRFQERLNSRAASAQRALPEAMSPAAQVFLALDEFDGGHEISRGEAVTLLVRLFKNDIEAALEAFHGIPQVALSPSTYSDSLSLRYLSRHLNLVVDGDTLPGGIVSSGEAHDIW